MTALATKPKLDRNHVPVLSKEQMERDVEELRRDYDPDGWDRPGALNVEHFAESYLGVSLHFDNLSHNGCIQAMTVFSHSIIPTFDEWTGRAEDTPIDGNTIVIDNQMLCDSRESQFRYALAHECGHRHYHPRYYALQKQIPSKVRYQGALTVPKQRSPFVDPAVVFFSDSPRRELKTPDDWLEFQANYFAGCLLMPRTAMENFRYAISTWLNTCDANDLAGSNRALILAVAETFNVSKKAARIRIDQLGLAYTEDNIGDPPF